MSTFKVGDRVRVKPETDPSRLKHGYFSGVVVSVDSDTTVRVNRDDGIEGLYGDGWLTSADILMYDPYYVEQPSHKHVMGLDPETLDMEAYKAFMRELQT